jgi:CRISPR-associated protein Csx3
VLTWKTRELEGATLATFELAGGLAAPGDLPGIDLPAGLDRAKGLVVGGRGPVWLYAHLCHLAHPFAWVATQDPRLGAVVVQRHRPDAPPLGAVIGL